MKLILEGENPYVVNAILKAASDNDYVRLTKDFDDLRKRFYALEHACLSRFLDPVLFQDDSENKYSYFLMDMEDGYDYKVLYEALKEAVIQLGFDVLDYDGKHVEIHKSTKEVSDEV